MHSNPTWAERLDTLDHEIARAKKAQAILAEPRERYTSELQRLLARPGRVDQFEERRQKDLQLAIVQLDRGLSSSEGTDEEVAAALQRATAFTKTRANGLAQIERLLARLQRDRDEVAARAALT